MEIASFEAYSGAELREVSTARTVDVVEYVLRRPSVAECLKDELGGVNSPGECSENPTAIDVNKAAGLYFKRRCLPVDEFSLLTAVWADMRLRVDVGSFEPRVVEVFAKHGRKTILLVLTDLP